MKKNNFFSQISESNLETFSIYQNGKILKYHDIKYTSKVLNQKIQCHNNELVGILCKNSINSICIYFSLKKLGLTPVIIPLEEYETSLSLFRDLDCSYICYPDFTKNDKEIENKLSKNGWSSSEHINNYGKIFLTNNVKKAKNTLNHDGDILFTSGTSGRKKGVFISNESIHSSIKYISDIMKLSSSSRELLGIPIFHSFGLTRARICIAQGAELYMPNKNTDLAEIVSIIKKYNLNTASFVPASIELLYKIFAKKIKNNLISLTKVELGSSGINHKTLEWFSSLCPQANIYHHYGMTEASRSAFRIYNFEEKFILGDKNKFKLRDDIEVSIKDIEDKNSNYDLGLLSIKGSNVFMGYLKNKDDFDKLKNSNTVESDDLVKLYKDKNISIIGKSSVIAKKGGKKISLIELEKTLESYEKVNDSLCYVDGASLKGDYIVCDIIIDKKYDSNKTKLEIRNALSNTSLNPDKINIVDQIKYTFNGKKIRKKIV